MFRFKAKDVMIKKVVTIHPESSLKEAVKIILLGSGVFVPDVQITQIFPDVPSEVWYGKFVAKAKNLNIISGDSSTGLFRPGDTINLAEILKILFGILFVLIIILSSRPLFITSA